MKDWQFYHLCGMIWLLVALEFRDTTLLSMPFAAVAAFSAWQSHRARPTQKEPKE